MWIGVSVPPAPEPATASAGPGPPASCVARDALAVVSRRARNRRHRSTASTAVTAGTSRPLPAPPPPHEAGYVPRLRPGTGRQPAAARPGSTIPSWGLECRANIEQGCMGQPSPPRCKTAPHSPTAGSPKPCRPDPSLQPSRSHVRGRPGGACPYPRLPLRRPACRHDLALWRRPEPLSKTRTFV